MINNKKKVIMVLGAARSGKDEVFNALHLHFNDLNVEHNRIHRYAFADLLKDQASELGWDNQKDEKGRQLLQHLGDVMREYHGDDYYAKYVANQIKRSNINNVSVVTDCRFISEFNTIKMCNDFDVTTVRIIRDNLDSDLTAEQKNHRSETEVSDKKVDITIHNNFETLEEYHDEIVKRLSHLIQTTP